MRFRLGITRTLLVALALVILPLTSFAEAQRPDNGRKFSRPPLPASVLKAARQMAARDDLARPDSDSGQLPNQVQYFVHTEDVSIQGSECVGIDCTSAEAFGFDTIRLKENNLRIRFQDTSASSSFPADDWEITVNESSDGGLNKFSITHIDGGRIPFTILNDARTNAIYAKGERVGFGTASPVTSLHTVSGDTPTLRLDQNASMGYAPIVWDVGGNDASFFVRQDGNKLSFRVYPGAPTNSLTIAGSGNVGVGTAAAAVKLHVSGTNAAMRVTNGGTTTLDLDTAGNLTLSGLVFESSSREVKENLAPVDPSAVLDRLSALDLYRWNYTADDPAVTHMGPTAEDFAAAFGLGADDKHIAALDASGVALSAIKALHELSKDKNARIASLESELRDERAKLEELAKQLTEIRALLEAK